MFAYGPPPGGQVGVLCKIPFAAQYCTYYYLPFRLIPSKRFVLSGTNLRKDWVNSLEKVRANAVIVI